MPSSSQWPDEERREKWMVFVRAQAPEINPRAIALVEELRRVSRALYQIGESSVAATGLSYAKMRLLMGLMFAEEIEGRHDGLHPSEISERQGISRTTISSLISALEAGGQVRRTLNQDDYRRFNIQLTDSGRELVYAHIGSHLRTIAGCFDALDNGEQADLSRLLSKLREQADETREALASGAGGA